MVDAGISVSNVSRSFGAVHAVLDASFEVQRGSVTALIGPNGSGKTTLMLMLASLLKPDSGSIRVAGFDPTTDPAAVRARMGWMPDLLGSWATLSVRTTLELTARMYQFDQARAAARAEELITLTGLQQLAGQPTRVLSRGQKQKLSLARALVHEPEVLLLDEPASGLDPAARVDLRQLVRRLAAEGRTVLISSHVLAELDEMADNAIYLDGGVTASTESVLQAKASARQWRVRSLDPPALFAAVTAADINGATVTVDHTGLLVLLASELEASALLARLVAAGVPVISFAPAVGDLEHTFLDLGHERLGQARI